jgi:hypothetical protein
MEGSIQQASSNCTCALRALLVSSLLPIHHSRMALQNGLIEWFRTQLEHSWCSLVSPVRSGPKWPPTLSTQRIACLTGLSTTSQSACGLEKLPLLLIFAHLAAGHGNTLQSLTSVLSSLLLAVYHAFLSATLCLSPLGPCNSQGRAGKGCAVL